MSGKPRRRITPRRVFLAAAVLVGSVGVGWYWSGSPRMTLEVGSRAYAVAFSPDGTLLAAGGAWRDSDLPSNGVIRLWDVETGRKVADWKTRGHYVWRLAFAGDGRTLTTTVAVPGDELPRRGEERVWELGSFTEVGTPKTVPLSDDFPLHAPAGGRVVKHGGWGVFVVCESATGEEIYRAEADRRQFNCAALSADGTLLVTGGGDTSGGGPHPIPWLNGDVRFWDVGTGRLLRTYNRHSSPIMGLAFSPDGRRAASASMDGTVKVWRVPSR